MCMPGATQACTRHVHASGSAGSLWPLLVGKPQIHTNCPTWVTLPRCLVRTLVVDVSVH